MIVRLVENPCDDSLMELHVLSITAFIVVLYKLVAT